MYTALYLLCTETDLINSPSRTTAVGFVDVASIFSHIFTDPATGYGPWNGKRLSDEWSGRWIPKKPKVWRLVVMKTSGNFTQAEMNARDAIRQEIGFAAAALGIGLGVNALAGDDGPGGGITPPFPKDRKGVVHQPDAAALAQWNHGIGNGSTLPTPVSSSSVAPTVPSMGPAAARDDEDDEEAHVVEDDDGDEEDDEEINTNLKAEPGYDSDQDADGSEVDDEDWTNWPRA